MSIIKGKTILLVDDFPGTCEALKKMVCNAGGIIECAAGLREGIVIERAQRVMGKPFDCVICDAGLPDTSINDVLEALFSIHSNGIPVRVITGTSDPEIITACQIAGIHVIQKSATPEGIMENIIYAIGEAATSDVGEVAKSLVENRQPLREIPDNNKWIIVRWFVAVFNRWPKYLQVISTVGSFIGVCSSIVAFCFLMIAKIDAKAIAREAAIHATEHYKEIADSTDVDVKANKARLTSLELFRASVESKLAALPRIEDKLDKIMDLKPQVDAMWQQRLDHKTNQDLHREGVIDLPGGPTPKQMKALLLTVLLLVTGCATKPKEYHAPNDAKMKAAEHRLDKAVTKARQTAVKVHDQIKDTRDAAVRVAALIAAAQVSIDVVNGFDQAQIPTPVREAIKALTGLVLQASNELRVLMTKFDELQLTVKQLALDQQEEGNAREELSSEQEKYRSEAMRLAQDATDERKARIIAETNLHWYRMHWWGSWIALGLGVAACILLAILKVTGKLAIKAAA